MFLMPHTILSKGLFVIAAFFGVFIGGLVIGFIAGLIVGNTAIGDTIIDTLETYQYMMEDSY